MRNTLRAALVAALCWAGPCCAALAAQEPSPGEVRLERAILAEEVEQDEATAIRRYRAIVDDAALDADLRDLARLRLGRILLRRGDGAGARELLAKAAANARVRERHRALFPTGFVPDGGGVTADDRIRADVLAASASLPLREFRDEARSRILLFGERAVPALVAAIEAADGPADVELVREASALIWEIGGDTARRWAEAIPRLDDLIERRAIVAGAIRAGTDLSIDLAPAFRALFDDPDAEIRLRLIEHALHRSKTEYLPPKAALVPYLVDPDPRVRNAARDGAHRPLSISHIEQGDAAAFAKAVLRLLDGDPAAPDPQTEAAIRAWLSETSFFAPDPDSLEVVFALIARQLPGRHVNEVTAVDAAFPRDAGREGALRAARALGPIGAEPSDSQRALDRAVGQLQPRWSDDAIDDAVELALLGYGPDVAWFARRADEEHWLRLRDQPEHVDISPLSSMFSVYPGLEIPPSVVPDWIARVERRLRERGTLESNPVEHVVHQIARQAAPAAIEWARGIATRTVARDDGGRPRREDPYAVEAVLGLVKGDTPRHIEALKEIALASDETIDPRVRTIAVAWCFHRAVEDAVALFRANADQLLVVFSLHEFGERVPQFDDLRWTVERPGLILGLEGFAGYTDERMLAILDELLAEGSEPAWRNLMSSSAYANRSGDFQRGWVATIAQHMGAAPNWDYRASAAGGVRQRVLDRSGPMDPELAPSCARIARELRRGSPDTPAPHGEDHQFFMSCVRSFPRAPEIHEVVRDFLGADAAEHRRIAWIHGRLCEPDPRVDFVEAGLRDPDAMVREHAYFLAVDLADGPARIDRIRAMLRDPLVRPLSALSEVRQVLDPALVPDVLPLLRDPNPEVRDAAQATLEAIEYYVTQQQRWQRLLAAGGIDAPSAAEALIRQAGADRPKDVRLLALESLGTLAVAETLPFLIRMIGDGDAEIAAAARAAIRRVHERAAPARREPGPAPSGSEPRSGQEGDKDR